jgi:hypothetical protein
LCALSLTSCGGDQPNSPTPAASSSTSSTPTSTSTTTSVAPTAAHYVGTIPQPAPLAPLPLDVSLFFAIPGGAIVRNTVRPAAIFTVTGGYNTGPTGFSGTVSGTLDGSPDTGTFSGVLTANLANGCVARRNYSGPLTRQSLNWAPGGDIDNCAGASPLTFAVTPQAATTPATTTTIPPSTTSSIGSTTTTTTTTVPPTTTTSPSTSTTSIAAAGNLTGTWDGYYTLNLVQTGANVSGSVGFPDFPSTPGYTISFSGPISGTITGTTVALQGTVNFTETVQDFSAMCRSSVSYSLQVTAPTTMSGTYTQGDWTCTYDIPGFQIPSVVAAGSTGPITFFKR